MARRTISGAFLGSTVFIEDGIVASTAYQSAYTPGTGVVAAAALGGPTQHQRWTVVALSVQAYLGFYVTNNLTPYGKLGKMLAGLILDQQSFPYSINTPVTLPPLPSDTSLVSSLWDPAVDRMPPSLPVIPTVLTNLLPVSASVIPATPIELIAGNPVGIALWMQPSLLGSSRVIGSIGLGLLQPTFTLSYEDDT